MSHVDEKADYTPTSETGSHAPDREVFERPTGLKGIYYNPYTQLCMVGFVCFLCPGMFNALNGLGGGGQVDSETNSKANVAVYSTFAIFGFFSGTINNVLGARLTLLMGSTGYALYIGSYLAVNIHPGAQAFVIASGAYLGACAGLLWTAQGSLMLSYPTESQKGRFISIFWAIFNLGAVMGSAVALGKEINSKANQANNGTYAGFLIITCIGVLIPMIMVDPRKMVRTDGTRVVTIMNPTWKAEIYALFLSLINDPWILLLFPMFIASNFFYTWQFSGFNGALFNIRTRALNSFIYYLAQILGSFLIGLFLDFSKLPRRIRAFGGWAILLALVFALHGWAYIYQKDYTRASTSPKDAYKIDFEDDAYIGRALLFVMFGILDAAWQTTAYWMMGAMSNDPGKLAFFVGYYKSIQSAGGAAAWGLDADKYGYMSIFIATWALLVAGLLFMVPMMHMRIKNHTVETTEIINGTEQIVRNDRTSS